MTLFWSHPLFGGLSKTHVECNSIFGYPIMTQKKCSKNTLFEHFLAVLQIQTCENPQKVFFEKHEKTRFLDTPKSDPFLITFFDSKVLLLPSILSKKGVKKWHKKWSKSGQKRCFWGYPKIGVFRDMAVSLRIFSKKTCFWEKQVFQKMALFCHFLALFCHFLTPLFDTPEPKRRYLRVKKGCQKVIKNDHFLVTF